MALRSEAEVIATYSGPFDPAEQARRATNPCEEAFYAQTDRYSIKWHHYLAAYDRHLSRYRGRPVRLLELGIHNGGSLQMWRRYLGDAAVIHGIDIDPRCAAIDDADLTIHIGSQDDAGLLQRVVSEMGGVDVVVDDGSHLWRHQIATFEILYPMLSPDGLYICEDVHTSYWSNFGEGRADAPSFVEYAKGLVDRLHGWYSLDERSADELKFTRMTRGVYFYDSMVLIEREDRQPPANRVVGSRAVLY